MSQSDRPTLFDVSPDGEPDPAVPTRQLCLEDHHSLESTKQSPVVQVPRVDRHHPPPNISRKQLIPRVQTCRRHRAAPYKTPRRLKKDTSNVVKPRVSRPANPRARFLCDLPAHDYILPSGGPLNFTVVEIICILPNWFRSRDLATRFQNNGISAGTHFLILTEHRQLTLPTETACERARDHISDAYRKAMRSTDPTWTKLGHRVPPDFVETSLLVNNICIEGVQDSGSTAPTAPITFKDLAAGLKKLPQDHDAGDLTRALDFALHNQRDDGSGQQVDFVFPDDLHGILERVGRAQIGIKQTDPYIIARYSDMLRQAQQLRYKKHAELRNQQQQDAELDRQMQMLAQQGRYPRLQPALQRDMAEPSVTAGHYRQDVQLGQLKPLLSNQANAHARVQTPPPARPGNNQTGLSPVDMDMQASDQARLRENKSPTSLTTAQESQYKYSQPSPSGRSESQVAATMVAWMSKHDRTANTAPQQFQTPTAEPISQYSKSPVQKPSVHPFQAPVPAFFSPIPELDQGGQHCAINAGTHVRYEPFDIDSVEFREPYSIYDGGSLSTPLKDTMFSQDDYDIFFGRVVVPESDTPAYAAAADGDSGIVGSSVLRLVDCVEGDDLGDTSELACAVRWARFLGELVD